jgi:hypothetical protein
LEMNPVCDGCKTPTVDTDAQSEEHSSIGDFWVWSSEGRL